jgi:hypothetical protein
MLVILIDLDTNKEYEVDLNEEDAERAEEKVHTY